MTNTTTISSTDNTDTLDYSRPSVIIDKNSRHITVRASAAYKCRRQLAYAARNYTVTNPPDELAINRMEAGEKLEIVALNHLKRKGWPMVKSFTEDMLPPNLRIKLSNKITITGNPDAIGTHPVETDNLPTLLEVKTRGNPAWNKMLKLGVVSTFPDAIAQLALYKKGLLQSDEHRHLIHPDSTGVLVSMNTDSKEVKQYKLSNLNIDDSILTITARLSALYNNLILNDNPEVLPSRDYDRKTDWQCTYCPFLDECYKDEIPPALSVQKLTKPTEEEIFAAVKQCEQADAVLRTTEQQKEAQAQKKEARKTLLNHLTSNNLDELEVPGSNGVAKKLNKVSREQVEIDLDKLSQLLPEKDYNDVIKLKVTEYLKIK